ncbi:MAG: hypothetical protein IJ690_02190 [Clostridia bacterium]|nr:hypothetical protein [Clostridia bacterium]
MKLLEYKQFNNSTDEEKSLNKKKVAVVAIIAVIILFLVLMTILYKANANFRNFMDKYILFKYINEKDLSSISIESDRNIYACAFYNYVAILENNKLTMYNSSGKEVQSFDVNISSPIFAVQDNYLLLAEKNQQKVYLFKDKKMLWSKDVEGQISRISVNENGYSSVIISGTSYKSVITTYTEDGQEVFKTFLSTTVAVDADISKDNKYLSFCEMDLSGTLIESKVKTISIDKAKQDPANSIVNTYEMPSNSVVTNIEYHERDNLICSSDTEIYSLKDGNISVLANLSDNSDLSFSGINLSKSYFKVIEDKFGINNQKSNVEIYNTSSNKSSTYSMNGIAKEVYTKDGVIAVNMGTEAYFIKENGYLIKKLTTTQEIRGIVISNNIAGIIYRNKVQFLSL